MLVDWKLKNGDEIVINDENVNVIYEDNIMRYIDKYGEHNIDVIKKIYEYKSKDGLFKVDFNKNIVTIEFDNFKQDYDIDSKYEEIDNIIRLVYSLGDEKKVIEITRKEEI